MSRVDEINKIVDEIGDADTLFEFAEKVYDKDVRIEEYENRIQRFCDKNAFPSLEEASSFLPEYKVGEEVFVKDPMTSEIITGKIIVVYSEHTIYEMPSFTYEIKFDDESDVYKQEDIIARVEYD